MSITDELREWAKGDGLRAGMSLRTARDQALAIADRIDAEHERTLGEWDYWESTHVELPKDADGVPIHIGDVMENIVCPSVHREVTGVGAECFYGWDDGNGRYSQFDVSCSRHHHAPTVEDVLREMLDAWGELPAEETNEAIVAEYAAKLQLREDS